ncbi:hypothetical protein [Oligoflexus tunisiensis]|uniref:hypothetical protein n=1 Tax=Oligoflexus tunisiensis TaxID=708132 RepID=UPI00114CDBD1|nr:hypothetical protein [Oligoflexus tunisiensis]
MALKGTEKALADAMHAAATGAAGDPRKAWEAVAKAISDHITAYATVTGTTPNGGPLVEGRVT